MAGGAEPSIYFSDVFGIDPEIIEEYGAFNLALVNDLLQETSADDDNVGPFWRLHHSGFTIKELGAQMTSEWGVPSSQLSITATPKTDEHAKLRLAESTRIGWPGDE